MYVTDYWICCSTTDIYIMFTTTLLRFKLSTYSFDLLQMAICTLYGAKCCVSPKRKRKCSSIFMPAVQDHIVVRRKPKSQPLKSLRGWLWPGMTEDMNLWVHLHPNFPFILWISQKVTCCVKFYDNKSTVWRQYGAKMKGVVLMS